MSSIPASGAQLSAVIQIQGGHQNAAALKSIATLRSQPALNDGQDAKGASVATEKSKALDAANQFEALLIHNMLKSMRKTTMSEDTSNQRAMYDDMLDQQLADTMVEAGGIGVAKHLLAQLEGQTGKLQPSASLSPVDQQRLRALWQEKETATTDSNHADHNQTKNNRLRMVSGLWSNIMPQQETSKQRQFVESLQPYAQASAQRIGTSTNAVLAIAALETGWGQSMLKDEYGLNSHNYFGIKANSRDRIYTENQTTEFIDGAPVKIRARFKSFNGPNDGMHGLADFLSENPRYQTALEHAGDSKRFLQELQKAGYATDPDYAEKAISILNQIERQAPPL